MRSSGGVTGSAGEMNLNARRIEPGAPEEIVQRKQLRTFARAIAAVCLLLSVAGCARRHREEYREPARTGVNELRTFVSGPIGVVLTNGQTYMARVNVSGLEPARDLARGLTGSVAARGSKLLFTADPGEHVKGERDPGLSVIWDLAEAKGYALSESLQGYAPISAAVYPTNAVTGARGGPGQKIDGHLCENEDVLVKLSDGQSVLVRTLRATDYAGITMEASVVSSNSVPLSVRLSKVQLQTLPDEAFMPPAAFTKYDSADAMLNEIVLREANLKRRPGRSSAADSSEQPPRYR